MLSLDKPEIFAPLFFTDAKYKLSLNFIKAKK